MTYNIPVFSDILPAMPSQKRPKQPQRPPPHITQTINRWRPYTQLQHLHLYPQRLVVIPLIVPVLIRDWLVIHNSLRWPKKPFWPPPMIWTIVSNLELGKKTKTLPRPQTTNNNNLSRARMPIHLDFSTFKQQANIFLYTLLDGREWGIFFMVDSYGVCFWILNL